MKFFAILRSYRRTIGDCPMYSYYKRTEQNKRFTVDPSLPLAVNEETLAEYQRLYRDALAPGTIKHLDHSQKMFRRWCREYGHDPRPPITPLVVTKYVKYLGGRVSLQTIKNRAWAIGELHKALFLPSPCKHRLVVLAIRAAQKRHGTLVKQAPALCKAEVIDICNRLGESPIEIRDKALLLVASDRRCRASELIAIKVGDIEEQGDNSGTVQIKNSKYDPYGRGENAYLSKAAMKATKRLIENSQKKHSDYLFTSHRYANPGGKPVPTTVSRIFKKLTGRNDISAHSTRVGGVHDAMRLGCDLPQIMNSGRWASPEMPAVYGRKLLASKSASAEVCRAYEVLFQND